MLCKFLLSPIVATLFCLALCFGSLAPVSGQVLEMERGNHISILGNTLAERMQHDGWLETLVQARFPERELVFRNLGFSGDELNLRLRSKDFGSPAEWLKRCQTDVVIAMFGYNESFADEQGIEAFRAELAQFVLQTKTQKFNGDSPPVVVLVSPAAFEDLTRKDPAGPPAGVPGVNSHLPDGEAINRRLARYTEAIRRVAEDEQVRFVDLFHPTLELWRSTPNRQYTINGVHLNEDGNEAIARILVRQLFGDDRIAADALRLQTLRQAVMDKNWHWFHRYRTTDGYSIFGGRADLAFTDGQTNREVAQRELEILDYMTAERDKVVHAVAQGRQYEPDDANAPPRIPVISNKPGEGPDGEHLFLSGEEAIARMEVHDGMEVNLFASEEQFPELASPVQMSFDTRGRLWVAVWPTYPHWQPLVEEMNDKLLIFSDTDSDGVADDMTVFADGLHNPTGFEFWNGGVIVAQAPDLWYLKDTDGDDVADVRMRILHGIDSADTHHTSNSFTLGPDGGLYFQEGTFHHSQIESPWGPPLRQVNAGVFRYVPRTQSIESYITYGFANPHGHVFDYWGQDFVTDGTGNVNYYATPFSGHLDYPAKHSGYFPFFQQWVRPAGSTEILSSGQFPDEFQGNYLIANVIGFQGLLHYQIHEDESGFSATEVKPIVKSTDPNFRPVDIEVGPDGAIYFVDWQNPIIGHMQHNLRDPNRDKVHGRVYRVTYSDRKPMEYADLTQLSIPELLDELKSPFNRVRYRARIELSGRDSEAVLTAVTGWIEGLDAQAPETQHHLLEALWVTQQHNHVDQPLLRRLLRSPEPRARAAAVKVLCYTRDSVPELMSLLQAAVNDPFPRVRLEAIRALSFVPTAESAAIALQALNHPRDRFIDYCLNETLRATESAWRQAVASGEPFAADNEAGLRFIMDRLTPAELSSMARNHVVAEELLSRPGILHETRIEAATELARENNTDARTELLSAIERLDSSDSPDSVSVLADLTHLFLHGDGRSPHVPDLSAIDFTPYVDQLNRLASTGTRPVTREVALATLIAAGTPFEDLWQDRIDSPWTFRDLVAAAALVDDEATKAAIAPEVLGLFQSFPEAIQAAIDDTDTTSGRFVRIELPGQQRTLTLAEVEVYAGGRNVAPGGQATQSTEGHGGTPDKAIDGDTDPVFSSGTQTHTVENRPNPWWQVDLGEDMPIEKLVVWNRNEGELGKRLDGFTVRILNSEGQEVFVKTGIPAPDSNTTIPATGDPAQAIRAAAINAIVHLAPGDSDTFDALAAQVLNYRNRREAVRGLSRLPRKAWVRDRLQPLVESIVERLSRMNTQQKTQPWALDELGLARELASELVGDDADRLRQALDDLGVTVVVLRPVAHRMQYDRKQFFVEAGKPFQLVLDNTDIMPHNVVITAPGAYAKVGIAAEQMVTDTGASGQAFIPDMPEVLHASRLLQPGQVQQMEIIAPAQPGQYPYVCTYPGHWRRMYGVMHVVEDLSEVSEEAMAPTVDANVATRPFVREWTVADLRGALNDPPSDMAFEQGRALFTELSCIQCHRAGSEEGGEVGPNLDAIVEKLVKGDLDREGLLRSMVEPSHEIAEEYRTWIIQDIDGRVHTGVVAERTDESIRLLANPLDNEEPVTILIDDIEVEMESKVSIMPAGLLNTCSREEILDLLHFVEQGGKKE